MHYGILGYKRVFRSQIQSILSNSNSPSTESVVAGREIEFSPIGEQLDDAALAMALMASVPEEADYYWAYLIELVNWELRKPKGMRNYLFLHRFACLTLAYGASRHRSRLNRESVLSLEIVHPAMAIWCCYILGRAGLPWEMLLTHVRLFAEGNVWPPVGPPPQLVWNRLLQREYSFSAWLVAAWLLEENFLPFLQAHYDEKGTPLPKRGGTSIKPWKWFKGVTWTWLLIGGASVTLAWMNLQAAENKLKEVPPTPVEEQLFDDPARRPSSSQPDFFRPELEMPIEGASGDVLPEGRMLGNTRQGIGLQGDDAGSE